MISRLNEIVLLFSFPILSVSTSFLVNIGKEMALPGFRTLTQSLLCVCLLSGTRI